MQHFFIICRYKNINTYIKVRDLISLFGHNLSHDWYKANSSKNALYEDPLAFERMLVTDLKGIKDADYIIAILSGGKDFYVELGASLVLNKNVIMLDLENHINNEDIAYHSHPNINVITSIDQLEKYLSNL